MTDKYDGGKGTAVHLLQHYFGLVAGAAGVQWDADNDAEVESIVDAMITASVQQFVRLDATSAARQDTTQENGVFVVFCSKCLTPVEMSRAHVVEYRDGYLCPACASKALAAVPVSAITYLMADIAPVDEHDKLKEIQARAAVTEWLEALEEEEDATQEDTHE